MKVVIQDLLRTIFRYINIFFIVGLTLFNLDCHADPIPDENVISRSSQSQVYNIIEYKNKKNGLVVLQQITTVYVNQEPGKLFGKQMINVALQISFHSGSDDLSHYFNKYFLYDTEADKSNFAREMKISILQDDPSNVRIKFDTEGNAKLLVFTKVTSNPKQEMSYFIQSVSAKLNKEEKEKYKIDIFEPSGYQLQNDNNHRESLFTMGWRRAKVVLPTLQNGASVPTQMGDFHYVVSGLQFTEVRNLKLSNVEKKSYMLMREPLKYKEGAALQFDLRDGKLKVVSAMVGSNEQLKPHSVLIKLAPVIQACEKVY